MEACHTCDTLWRLYDKATENLRELVGKHRDSRANGEQHTIEILSHELNIAESSVRVVRYELRRHETARHRNSRPQESPAPEPHSKERQPQKP
jgi:hypothetical protein